MSWGVLVPLDGSPLAEHALPLATCIARQAGGILHLLRVVPALSDQFFWVPEPGDQLEVDLRERNRTEASAYLNEVAQRIQKPGDSVAVCDVVEEKDRISDTISAEAVRVRANLVVITSHGRGALERFWFGSVADELIRSLTVPVLVVPPVTGPADPAAIRHILVALDGSELAEQVLEPTLAIGKLTGADYLLVQVVPSEHSQLHEKANTYLRQVAERLQEFGNVRTRVVEADHPAKALLQETAHADLIALQTHGRRGLSRMLLGSVADKVIRASTIPILVCRSPQL